VSVVEDPGSEPIYSILKILGKSMSSFSTRNKKFYHLDQHTEILKQKFRFTLEICKQSNKPVEECASSMLDMVIKKQKGERMRIIREHRIFGRTVTTVKEIKIFE